jgi:hypothetical protein
MGLQLLGDADVDKLVSLMQIWAEGNLLEKRAAAAALCEPRLLKQARNADATLVILNKITASIEMVDDRHNDDFRILRKGLGYCWSVAVVASPDKGKALMERWLVAKDKDIRWIMKEYLKKKRLLRMDSQWVETWQERISK